MTYIEIQQAPHCPPVADDYPFYWPYPKDRLDTPQPRVPDAYEVDLSALQALRGGTTLEQNLSLFENYVDFCINASDKNALLSILDMLVGKMEEMPSYEESATIGRYIRKIVIEVVNICEEGKS